jgi:hypothetical protein
MTHDKSSEANLETTPTMATSQPEKEQKINTNADITYPEKTDRLLAWSDLIKSASKFIWIGVVLVIILQLWGNFAASNNLDQWRDEAVQRVNHPFLDWYYNYFTQLGIGIKAIWVNLTATSDSDKAEKLIGAFQREFAKQVLQPSLMQLQMERFTRQAIDVYTSEVSRNLAGLQSKYSVPQPTWENFLQGLGHVTYNTGTKSQDLTLASLSVGRKTIAISAMAKAVGIIGTKKVVTATVNKATSKVVTKLATKTATKAVTEGTGELTAGLLGLELLNPLAGLGVLAWDIWDHYHTVKVERPIMQENLERYLNEVEASLLDDSENGILSSINKFHDGIMEKLSRAPKFAG